MNDQSFSIREASFDDASNIMPLILELYEFLQMPSPKIGTEQLSQDLKSGTVQGLLAFRESELAAYSLFCTFASSEFGKIFLLEDIYIREQYRRTGLGRIIFDELVKAASRANCPTIEWGVLKSNTKAIAFYDKLNGAENITKNSEQIYVWRLEECDFKTAIRKNNIDDLSIQIHMDGKAMNKKEAAHISEFFYLFGNLDYREHNLIQFLMNGYLGAILVRTSNGIIVGILLFSRAGYSSFVGPLLSLDQILVTPRSRRMGIGTMMMEELIKIAKSNNRNHLQWKMSEKCSEAIDFFKSMNALRLDQYYIYQWRYQNIQ